ncbi:MAG TPA: transporter substrate-binding domain-containing protein [Miltoncostaeaceae bacterium]|nr:transporter substrate-binding domain-containing protein [Miltoncostaeaceae bacterium]
MRRRVLAAVIAGAGATALFGAPGAGAQDAGALSTHRPGLLTVGLNMPSQGFQVGAIAGQQVVYAQGLEVDLARALARKMGLRGVWFVQQPELGRLIGAGPKPWDIALAQATATAGRKRLVSFSVPYLASDQAVLLRRGLPAPEPSSLADLKPLRLCVQASTTGVAVTARRIAPLTAAVRYRDRTNMLQALQAGRCDAVVLDAAILNVQQAATPERYGRLMGRIPTGERYAAILERNSALIPPVNRALNALRRDGTIDRLITRWVKVHPEELPVIPPTGGAPSGGPTTPVRPPSEPVPLP